MTIIKIRLVAKNNSLSETDFLTFMQAKSYQEKLDIISKHALKNKLMKEEKNMLEEDKEIEALNQDFKEFLKQKGLMPKFKFAFNKMSESTKQTHQADKEEFERIKEESIKNNQEFYDFLHTKGFKNKVKLVIKNIKEGASKNKVQATAPKEDEDINNLTKELNEFLKSKGLTDKYIAIIEK